MWSSSVSIYNQEIIMQSGTVYYGNIIYQDPEFVTLETLIGKLNININQIVRVVSHKVPEKENTVEFPDIALNQSIASVEDGSMLYNRPAEVILLGNITSYSDDRGDTKLAGNVKNIGGKRADFVKLNITLYRDWSKKYQASPEVEEAWKLIYEDTEKYWELYMLAERITSLEYYFQEWRFKHMNSLKILIWMDYSI